MEMKMEMEKKVVGAAACTCTLFPVTSGEIFLSRRELESDETHQASNIIFRHNALVTEASCRGARESTCQVSHHSTANRNGNQYLRCAGGATC